MLSSVDIWFRSLLDLLDVLQISIVLVERTPLNLCFHLEDKQVPFFILREPVEKKLDSRAFQSPWPSQITQVLRQQDQVL